MRTRIFSVSVRTSCKEPYVAMYRTDGTATGGGLRMYDLTVDRLSRLTLAMLNTSEKVKTYQYKDKNGFSWCLFGLVGKMHVAAQTRLEKATLG